MIIIIIWCFRPNFIKTNMTDCCSNVLKFLTIGSLFWITLYMTVFSEKKPFLKHLIYL